MTRRTTATTTTYDVYERDNNNNDVDDDNDDNDYATTKDYDSIVALVRVVSGIRIRESISKPSALSGFPLRMPRWIW